MRLRANLERHGRRWMPYAILMIVATLMIIALRIPLSRLDVPYVFTGDAVDKLTQIANVAQTGWLFHNDRLGFPFGYDRLDFPRFDSLNYALIGPVAALVGPARAMNLYFLACFYLIAFAAFWSLRRLGLAPGSALLCSLIYAFLPYRIVRNVGHLTNAAYYLVPLAIVVLVWLARDRLATRPRNARGAFIFALAIAVLVPLQMPYNGVYFAYLAVIACAIALAGGARSRAIVMTAALLAATALAFVAEQIPAMLHARDAGKASLVADRDPAEAELYSMRLNQVLIPTIFDRRRAAASAKEAFDDAMAVPVTEARDQYFGVLGVIGFIALMWALCRAVAWSGPARTLYDDIDAETAARIAALFALAILVLAISTGLGTLISYWITAKIRTYNRVLPFFAFACLIGGGWALQSALARIRAPWLRAAALSVVAVLALYDILLRPPFPHRSRAVVDFDQARAYFDGVEQRLGRGAAVLQFPVSWYPEHASINAMADYEEFKPFLLTRTLRFSYGFSRGRSGYNWNKYIEGLPVGDAIAEAHKMGFAAILIDATAYTADTLKSNTDALASALPDPPSVSSDQHWWLFPLRGCCSGAAANIGPANLRRAYAYTPGSEPIRFATGASGVLYAAGGWEDPESWGMWTTGTHAALRLRIDPLPRSALTLVLETRMLVGPDVPERRLAITANGHRVADAVYTLTTATQSLSILVPPGTIGSDGELEINFDTTPDASPQSAGVSEDGRSLGVGLEALSLLPAGGLQ